MPMLLCLYYANFDPHFTGDPSGAHLESWCFFEGLGGTRSIFAFHKLESFLGLFVSRGHFIAGFDFS